MMMVIVVIMIMLIITGPPRGRGDCTARRNRGRRRATKTTMIKITFFFFGDQLFAAVVDLSLIGRAPAWGVKGGYLCLWFRMTKRRGTVENIPATPFEGRDLAALIWIINRLKQTDLVEKGSKWAKDSKVHRGSDRETDPCLVGEAWTSPRLRDDWSLASNRQTNYSLKNEPLHGWILVRWGL